MLNDKKIVSNTDLLQFGGDSSLDSQQFNNATNLIKITL